jgi:hypothetical protein
VTPPDKGRTRASNRLSHGLRSQSAREQRLGDAEALAGEVLAGLPPDAEIARLAVNLAEAMLYLNAVRSAKLALYAPGEAVGTAATGGEGEGEDAARGSLHAAALAQGEVAAARRLANYERKATSWRNGLIRRLDHLTLEARRRAS